MAELPPDITKATGMCRHGNFPSSCELCLATENVQEQRRQKLQELAAELDTIGDKLGHPIDMGIRDTLVGLKAHGIETSASCEGHDDHGTALPWVDIETPGPEGWRNDKQKQSAWKAKNDQLATKVLSLIERWYKEREDAGEQLFDDLRIELHPRGIFGAVRLEPALQERISELPSAERSAKSHPQRQEMQLFAEYLKTEFLKQET